MWEINSLKYTSRTEKALQYSSSGTLSLEEDFTVPATQKGATGLHPQGVSKIICKIISLVSMVVDPHIRVFLLFLSFN